MTVEALIQITRPPLRHVAGLPLLTRAILGAASCGARRVTVVTEMATAELAPALDRARREDVEVTVTASAEAEAADGRQVLVLHTDGLVTPAVMTALLQPRCGALCPASGDGLAVCVPAPGQRVRLDAAGGRDGLADQIFDLGRQLPCIDNGYPAIADRQDIDGAERVLFGGLAKSSDGPVSRYLNRPVSTRISRRLSRYEITPMQLTAVTALFALLMTGAFATATSAGIIAGGLLFHLASVVDGLDGEIARAKFLASRSGAAWDTGVDMATNLLFIGGLVYALTGVYGSQYAYLGAYLLLAALAAVTLMTIVVRLGPGGGSFDILGRALQRRLHDYPRLRTGMQFIDKVFKRDFYALAFAVMAVTGLATWIPWILAVGMTLWLLVIILNIRYMISAPADMLLPDHIKALRS